MAKKSGHVTCRIRTSALILQLIILHRETGKERKQRKNSSEPELDKNKWDIQGLTKKLSDHNKHLTSKSWSHSRMLMSFCIILDFNYFSLPATAHSDLAGNSCSELSELKMDNAFAP